MSQWQNLPPTWSGFDPCGSAWQGITCDGNRVISISLPSMNLEGSLTGDIQGLTELQILDLSYNTGLKGPLLPAIGKLSKLTHLVLIGCGFYGRIPNSIGSLTEMYFLALNLNNFTEEIPASIGNLKRLYWLDLGDNQLTGSLPVSSGTNSPGLDLLFQTNHFHFGNNRLSGSIPSALLSSNMSLIHLLLDNNNFTGEIPTTLGLVTTLEVVRLDRNLLSGTLPSNLNNLTTVSQMLLSNNYLTGMLPNLTGMDLLTYVDISNNSFGVTDATSWLSRTSTMLALTTLILESTNMQGSLPVELFSLPQLQTLILRDNKINGTLDVGSSYSTQLSLIDLQQNNISSVAPRGNLSFQLILVNNPTCQETPSAHYCTDSSQPSISYSTPQNCIPQLCSSGQIASPRCACAYPYTGTLVLRAPTFSNLGNDSYFTVLETSLMSCFSLFQQPVDSVSLSNPTVDDSYLKIILQMFPLGQIQFNRTGIITVGGTLSTQIFKPPDSYGPYYFNADAYTTFAAEESPGSSSKKRLTTAAIIGIAVAGSVLILLLVLIVIVLKVPASRRGNVLMAAANRRVAGTQSLSNNSSIPNVSGARRFPFEELKKCTNNFSEANDIGSGGYGKVYKGVLPNGRLVAVKRANPQSTQGGLEFKTEIELLSRLHHRNLVSLLGYCFEQGELMLVYEYVPNGNLRESLSGKSGVRLDWRRRIDVALGAARGLQYLHEHANPPIIHRDIKSNNILLDETLHAKVSDFGVSKPLMDSGKSHITTQVKGTLGYVDPEYYMTEMLTEKSDVYSFGVLMLEMISGKPPIERGRYIVREIRNVLDKSQDLYNLHALIDPGIGLGTTMAGFEQFVDLALMCVEESGARRPAMGEVVKQLENIMEAAGLNPFSVSTSSSVPLLDSARIDSRHPYPDFLYGYSRSIPRR